MLIFLWCWFGELSTSWTFRLNLCLWEHQSICQLWCQKKKTLSFKDNLLYLRLSDEKQSHHTNLKKTTLWFELDVFFPVVIFKFWILKFKQTIFTREKRSLKAQKICHGVINCRTSFYCFEKSLIAFGTKCFQIYFWSLHSDKVALSHCPGIYIENRMQSFVGDGVNAER